MFERLLLARYMSISNDFVQCLIHKLTCSIILECLLLKSIKVPSRNLKKCVEVNSKLAQCVYLTAVIRTLCITCNPHAGIEEPFL